MYGRPYKKSRALEWSLPRLEWESKVEIAKSEFG